MSVSTTDGVRDALTHSLRIDALKTIAPSTKVGAFQSTWRQAGRPTAAGTEPDYLLGSGYSCSSSTAGAMANYVNGATQNYLARARVAMQGSQAGVLILADRLWHCSGMGPTAIPYAVLTPGALPARITDNGVGCEIWLNGNSATNIPAGSCSVAYVEPGGAAKTGVIQQSQLDAGLGANEMIPCPLQVGDTGVKQITSVTPAATFGTGSFGVVVLKRICEIPINRIEQRFEFGWKRLGMPRIPSDACLFAFVMNRDQTAAQIHIKLDIVDL